MFHNQSSTKNLPWIMLYSICILIRWCFRLFVQISFKTRLSGRKYCCRLALPGKLWKEFWKKEFWKSKFKHSYYIHRLYLPFTEVYSIDSSSLQNIVSLFFLFRVRYKICTRCCQEALQRTKFDRLTLPCYTTIQIPVTRDFLAPIGALVVAIYVRLSIRET